MCVCDVKMSSNKDEATRSGFMAIYAPWPQGITYRRQNILGGGARRIQFLATAGEEYEEEKSDSQ